MYSYIVHCTSTLHTVSVHCTLYQYIAYCTSALHTVPVHCILCQKLHTVPVHCSLYQYIAQCTCTLHSAHCISTLLTVPVPVQNQYFNVGPHNRQFCLHNRQLVFIIISWYSKLSVGIRNRKRVFIIVPRLSNLWSNVVTLRTIMVYKRIMVYSISDQWTVDSAWTVMHQPTKCFRVRTLHTVRKKMLKIYRFGCTWFTL